MKYEFKIENIGKNKMVIYLINKLSKNDEDHFHCSFEYNEENLSQHIECALNALMMEFDHAEDRSKESNME